MRLEQLGFLLVPAHFLLALLLLQPYFAPTSQSERDVWGAAEVSLPVRWVVCAAFTALLAARPIWVGTRRLERRGLVWVAFAMAGWGYVNLLVCLAVRDVPYGADGLLTGIVGVIFLGTLFGVPSGVLCTLPFLVLTLPVVGLACRWERDGTFDDRDALLRAVGLHALLIVALVAAAHDFERTTADTPVGVVTMAVTAAYGVSLVLVAAIRTFARRRFLGRVLRHEHPEFEVEGTAFTAPPLAVARWTRSPSEPTRVLVHLPTMPAEGAYRTNQPRTPVARL